VTGPHYKVKTQGGASLQDAPPWVFISLPMGFFCRSALPQKAAQATDKTTAPLLFSWRIALAFCANDKNTLTHVCNQAILA